MTDEPRISFETVFGGGGTEPHAVVLIVGTRAPEKTSLVSAMARYIISSHVGDVCYVSDDSWRCTKIMREEPGACTVTLDDDIASSVCEWSKKVTGPRKFLFIDNKPDMLEQYVSAALGMRLTVVLTAGILEDVPPSVLQFVTYVYVASSLPVLDMKALRDRVLPHVRTASMVERLASLENQQLGFVCFAATPLKEVVEDFGKMSECFTHSLVEAMVRRIKSRLWTDLEARDKFVQEIEDDVTTKLRAKIVQDIVATLSL